MLLGRTVEREERPRDKEAKFLQLVALIGMAEAKRLVAEVAAEQRARRHRR